eukprot:Phypoly_transcript_05708.p1 GENE.Phypoly_transcript_05708~~Phypoly_transcript_05708.p1  ORF type:complete len:615 (+),score=95.81 Phypoly_transcript_05708:46-1890(+)
MMDNFEIANVFQEIATIYKIIGESQHKINAYTKAARQIEALSVPLKVMYEQGTLDTVEGIGKKTQDRIRILLTTGRLEQYEDLKKLLPPGVAELMRIPTVGPVKTRILWETLHIKNMEELEKACVENKLVNINGLGARVQAKILEGIAFVKDQKDRVLYTDALPAAETLCSYLKESPYINRVQIAGSLRRHRETIKDIDLVASSNNPEEAMNAFYSHPLVKEKIAGGKAKARAILTNGMQADLCLVADDEFVSALHYFTGSKEHNIVLRSLAHKAGFKVSEWGIFLDDKKITLNDETDFFRTLGLQYIPPEMREGFGEVEVAAVNKIPHLIEEKDIKGLLHIHTSWSDGVHTIEAHAQKAIDMGLEYIAITEHSKSAGYAHGMTAEKVLQQMAEIDKIRLKFPQITILKGIEVDILGDGTLDFSDDLLSQLDVVIGAVHGQYNMPRDVMTKRICKSFENPYLDVFAHPSGRKLLSREGYTADLDEVFDCALKEGVAIEINAQPTRLDLDWRYMKSAKEKNIKFSINPDAHSTQHMEYIKYGVGIARKGWLTKDDVINTRSLSDFTRGLRSTRYKLQQKAINKINMQATHKVAFGNILVEKLSNFFYFNKRFFVL